MTGPVQQKLANAAASALKPPMDVPTATIFCFI
jgi:hypothetical protein